MRRHLKLLAPLAALLLSLACAASARAEVRLQNVGPVFDNPVHIAGAPGDGERLYVVEQGGVVKVVRGGSATVFVDLTSQVLFDNEQGLLSIAFPPDFQTSRLFYVYYTNRAGDNEVDELRAPTGDAADPASRRLVLPIPHPVAGNHNGGQLQFGPDGYLYLAPGDGARGNETAQNLDSLLGKVLRIDPRGGVAGSYTVPADNPFAGQAGARGEIWARGLRNPFRFSFDRSTGDLVLGDVGQGTTEEIDWVPASAGAARGGDFGWADCEGSFVQGSKTRPCTRPGTILPIIDRFADEGFHSIIPGYVVRDPTLPSLFGRLVYGDYFVPALRSAVPSNAGATDAVVGVSVPSLSSFGEDAGGCVYAASKTDRGSVYRLVETDARIPCAPAAAVDPGTIPTPSAGSGDRPAAPCATCRPGAGGSGAGGCAGCGSSGRSGSATRPGLRTSAPRAQRVLLHGAVVLYARCTRACRVSSGGTLTIGRRRFELRSVARTARAGARVRIAVRLSRRARAALRRAVRAGKRPKIVLRVRARATGSGGARSRLVRVTVRVKG
ncbi:sorbosone dehydrogenase family protein [Conexibacter sp. CPCC 206217]|uniref:PQQ-dependent sugar dehydrogenase n=1 Tax=Conexibacter sp. CPCC 206217 TaxID=3064574 RepID=UPI00271FC3AE|nr:PQQ-dependent sugar dehydrogenase [Conexibacter sp. CPCC 206217]MDO8213952.1 PQQ-dependent sugar dehydrogenase [Conexibacter sp. CPCC 206217]